MLGKEKFHSDDLIKLLEMIIELLSTNVIELKSFGKTYTRLDIFKALFPI